ncbi:aldolase [Actinotignum timonense]|uniref:Aldolase n=2 Tax=Actinomycetaceae TaxID=2049 RepID=A0AAW9HKZ2_9ACTO|nr:MULTISPECIES: aldolase [Actinotignum]MDE1558245.1 aldolase [Actinotignum schaalii]MDE1663058.1 aldolase [Actinotignum schaalii]MDK6373083.1 aldolase [Actinotignum timonense]MDK6419863.1 aldolase [Actinotignum timonense]MDK6646105.1 aldolase [Actinotignum timonense]
MEDRFDLLARLCDALAVPGVSGLLGTADIIEDLALLRALDGKWVYGSMNRAGLAGAAWELDDRITGYTAKGIAKAGLQGGKILLRIAYQETQTVGTLEMAGKVVTDLARRQRIAMVEPFISRREGSQVVNDVSTDAVTRSIAIASGLGANSSYTVLKLPDTPDLERFARATTLPIVILGGEVSNDAAKTLHRWALLLEIPNVIGLVIGRSLLYPQSGDVQGAVANAAQLLS